MLVKRNVKRVYEAQFWPSEIRSAGGHCVEGVAGGKRGCSSEFLVRPATHLSVVLDVVSERDEARLELLWVESSRARLVEVQERASELLQLLVADALRVARQDLHHSAPHHRTSFSAHHRRISTVSQIFISPWTFFLPLSPWTLTLFRLRYRFFGEFF